VRLPGGRKGRGRRRFLGWSLQLGGDRNGEKGENGAREGGRMREIQPPWFSGKSSFYSLKKKEFRLVGRGGGLGGGPDVRPRLRGGGGSEETTVRHVGRGSGLLESDHSVL